VCVYQFDSMAFNPTWMPDGTPCFQLKSVGSVGVKPTLPALFRGTFTQPSGPCVQDPSMTPTSFLLACQPCQSLCVCLGVWCFVWALSSIDGRYVSYCKIRYDTLRVTYAGGRSTSKNTLRYVSIRCDTLFRHKDQKPHFLCFFKPLLLYFLTKTPKAMENVLPI